jgi:hypothetical protein
MISRKELVAFKEPIARIQREDVEVEGGEVYQRPQEYTILRHGKQANLECTSSHHPADALFIYRRNLRQGDPTVFRDENRLPDRRHPSSGSEGEALGLDLDLEIPAIATTAMVCP